MVFSPYGRAGALSRWTRYTNSMIAGEIDGYQYALIEATNLIAVRRPDGTLRMLPGAPDVAAAVRSFIRDDKAAPRPSDR
jgi:hypothetical protein